MALCAKDLPSVWLPQIPLYNSSSSNYVASGSMHSKYGLENERLYNFWSSDSQNRGAFLRTFTASNFFSGKMSSFKNDITGSIQLGPTLTWWTWTISLSTPVGLYKSSIRMTRGRPCDEEVASVARESAWVFPLLGMCNRLKDSNHDHRCPT